MSFLPRTPYEWTLRTRVLALGGRTVVMGIVNVTPDSFSDGGLHFAMEPAVRRALEMLDAGADVVDVGGESTRPGAAPLTEEAEQRRVLPVIRAILEARPEAVLSVDTYHAATAGLAVEAGAEIVNDVSGFTWDEGMAGVCAGLGCGVVLMHTRGRPAEWAGLPGLAREDVMPTVVAGLRAAVAMSVAAGVARERLVVDPGMGFGKRGAENFAVLANLDAMRELGHPVLAGSSRKGFLRSVAAGTGAALPAADSAVNDLASHAAVVAAVLAGAHVIRVHDVAGARVAAAIADAVLYGTRFQPRMKD